MMEIIHPTLLIDKKRCLANIKKMARKAGEHNLAFKPHFKTHQSLEVGRWFKEEGVEGITVSSIKMAEYFANAGWKDITIAFPVNINAASQINELAERVNLTLLLDNPFSVAALTSRIDSKVDILVEVDAGSKRTGIPVDDDRRLVEVLKALDNSPKLNWKGFYSHFGHTYSCRGEEEIVKLFSSSLQGINELIRRNSLEGCNLHIGDTPGCSVSQDFKGVTAITPGNFVFYDVMQMNIGSCKTDDIAVVMVCPVVSKNPQREEITVHGGAVHFSKDSLKDGGIAYFGVMVDLEKNGIGAANVTKRVVALSQEHGTITVGSDYDKYEIGDLIGILPIHSCLTAECMGGYKDFEGKNIDHL